MIQLMQGDCLERMKEIPDGSVGLVCIDPPYNINKASWDKIDNYHEWIAQIFRELQRVLAKNGSLYCFHNDVEYLSSLICYLKEKTNFILKQFIVWNKRFNEASNKGFLDGFVVTDALRNYQKMAEYCLFYTFQDETGLTTIKLDTNNFTSLRNYFKDYQEALGMTKKAIIEKIGQRADHCFRWKSSQWDMPTEETYLDISKIPLTKPFSRREYDGLRREYDGLRREYEGLRYTFNNQKTHHSVWNYEIAERCGHVTPKPVPLIENIIEHSSKPNSVVLDCFMGSGTTGIACKNLNRKFIGIELDETYFNLAKERIENHAVQEQVA